MARAIGSYPIAIAQLARAIGSYPIGRGFKSNFRYHFGPLVKRSRHRPFTAVTGVRFPHGSPKHPLSIDKGCFFFCCTLYKPAKVFYSVVCYHFAMLGYVSVSVDCASYSTEFRCVRHFLLKTDIVYLVLLVFIKSAAS